MNKHRQNQSERREQGSFSQPSSEEIAQRAYSLYEENGREEGHALDHWVQAEEALRGQQSNSISGRKETR